MKSFRRALFGLTCAGLIAGCTAAQENPVEEAGALKVYFIDVEGGSATLYVTPGGQSLLVDTGWPAGLGNFGDADPGQPPPSSAERIVAAARDAGVERIDYLMITHYHIDHVGGVHDLLQLIPVGTVIDHGPNREELPENPSEMQRSFSPATLYQPYKDAIGDRSYRMMKAGDVLEIDGLTITAVTSDRQIISDPLPGGGAPGAGCTTLTTMERDGGEENPRSLGFLARWGDSTLLALADLTWDMEAELVCPTNLIGTVDVMVANNHGSEISNHPALLASINPQLVVIANGPRKGGDAATYAALTALPSPPAIWQLHEALREGALNTDEGQIANPGAGPDAMHPLKLTLERDGKRSMTNPRTGLTMAY